MNCSGKHAAMLATCVRERLGHGRVPGAGAPAAAALRRTVEELAGEPVTATGVDGCGAPLFALTLGGLARAFRALVLRSPAPRSAGWPTPCARTRSGPAAPTATSAC